MPRPAPLAILPHPIYAEARRRVANPRPDQTPHARLIAWAIAKRQRGQIVRQAQLPAPPTTGAAAPCLILVQG